MSNQFRRKIHAALADSTLQEALDANAERRIVARQQAYASLREDFLILRQRAKAVREDTLTNLEDYLSLFIERATENGITVHQASTASQAVDIVRQIARDSGARVISKSKTMVGEEIHLNQALEADGLIVVETDLGEYIVQLRGEPPAHIITPAVHLTRRQVGLTFQDKLGIPFTEDIPSLTSAARAVLRQNFLETDIGISGVNFGIAETGGLCLLTNEGNGRMVTTLPKIHIALMGLERLVPSLADLALMLDLLPRSATGQKITVYTSLIHRPRRSGEIDGPQQRHLILLDNGRRAMRQSDLAEMLYCIRCGACLNACPVFREIGGHAYVSTTGENTPYPGPMGSVVSPALFGVPEFGNLARASSLCGACQEACPVDIPLPKLLLRVRAAGAQKESSPPPARTRPRRRQQIPPALRLGLNLFAWATASPKRYQASQKLASIAGKLASPASAWLRLPAFTGWGTSRDFPRPAARTFRQHFQANAELPVVKPQSSEPTLTPVHAISEKDAKPMLAANDLVAKFKLELEALGGEFFACSAVQAAQKILALLKEAGIGSVQTWNPDLLPGEIVQALAQAGIQMSQHPRPDIRAGLTGALGAAASTASLALTGGPGQPMTASLLPEIHIAVLEAPDIVPQVVDLLELIPLGQAENAVLISGPSRTADIEMTLTIGVHGPRRLLVFCIGG